MAFQDQVEDITSLSVSDTGELSQFLKDGVIDVTSRWLLVRPQDISVFSRESAETTSNASLDINGAQIISVIRENGTNNQWRNCRQIFPAEQYDVTDTESLSYASKYNPAFMIGDNGQISVFPTPGTTTDAFKAYYVNNVPVDKSGAALIHSHSDIGYFADDKVYLVVMYAGIRLLQATMGNNVILLTSVPPDVPTLSTVSFSESNALSITATEPTAISLTTVNYDSTLAATPSTVLSSLTAPTYTKPSTAVVSVPPDIPTLATVSFSAPTVPTTPSDPSISSPGISTVAKADISGDVPTYTKPYLDDIADSTAISGGSDNTTKLHRFSEEFTSIGDLSITAVPPDVPTISTISYSPATETDIGSVGGVTVTGITFPTADIPTYTKTSLQTDRVALSGYTSGLSETDPGTFSITAVPPDVPTLSDTSIAAFSASVPAYAAPTVTAASTELTEMEALTGDALGTDADFYDFEKWFTALGEMIEDEEDTELAQAQIGKISTYIQAYGQAMQNQLNIFNDANVEFQADIQRKFKEADFDNQEDARLLQKYSAEVQEYQAEVGAQVQEYTQKLQQYTLELNTAYQAWAKTESDSLQEYQLNIQNELNEFNMENADFQLKFQEAVQEAKDANQVALQNMQKDLARAQTDAQSDNARRLQDAIQSMQDDVANNASLIQKFQTEITEYQAEVNTEVQEYQANWNKQLQEWSGYQKTVLQHYQIEIQNELNDFNKENARYQANIQATIAKFQADAAEAQKEGDLEFQARIQDYTQELALFNGELQKYQTEVQSDVQTMQGTVANNQDLLGKFQAETVEYQAEVAAEMQVIQVDIQNELNEFNKENTAFGYEVQKALADAQATNQIAMQNGIQEARDAIENNNAQVQRFQSMAQHYATEVNEDVQKYTSQLQSDIQDMQGTIANNQALLTKYQAETAEYQVEIAAETQEQSVKMQHYQLLYNQLKAEYDQAFMIAAPPQQQQAEA